MATREQPQPKGGPPATSGRSTGSSSSTESKMMKQYGPLPGWGWAIVALSAAWLYRTMNAKAAPPVDTSTSSEPVSTGGYYPPGSYPYQPDPTGTSTSTPGFLQIPVQGPGQRKSLYTNGGLPSVGDVVKSDGHGGVVLYNPSNHESIPISRAGTPATAAAPATLPVPTTSLQSA